MQESQETRYNLDPVSFFVNCFRDRRQDGVALNETLQIVHISEFKRSTDRDTVTRVFLKMKETEAEKTDN